ncbi:MAG TPA: hypothetical protein VM100_07350 [Longimicrobiales bacterium]|nr:hypothetical protein [Longimicrobiales bacterium]
MRKLIISALLLGACSHPLEPTYDPNTGTYAVEFSGDGNLVQRIVLSNANPNKGSVIDVRSTIFNGGVKRDLTTRICGLDIGGLDLVDTDAHCAGFSQHITLATNDTISQTDRRTVNAAPGEYTMKIRHLLEPERWVELKLHVK